MLSVAGTRTIGVVGAGTMGRGIVQLFAAAGFAVRCVDASPAAAEDAIRSVSEMLRSLAAKGRIDPERSTAAIASMTACAEIGDLSGCDLVVEAIVEDLDAKRRLFQSLEEVVGGDTMLATNTSSLMVSEIAAACALPSRVAGLHFFNPVPLMRVVEVIPGLRTSAEVSARLRQVVEATGHRAVVAEDQPGFLVNHAGRGLYTEGLRIVEERVCTHFEVDRILREALGFRMGPFELLDLTGLDVSGKVMESIYEQFHQEPRFRPSSLVAPRIAAGLLGRKSGEGWYRYADGKRVDPDLPCSPIPGIGPSIWVDPAAQDAIAIRDIARAAGRLTLEEADAECLCIVQPWGVDATATAQDLGLDPARCIAVDPLPGMSRHRTLMLTVSTTPAMRDTAHALFTADGTSATIINDSPGFVTQRVLAVIVNIAANIVQRGIASVEDLEDAVRLGLGYPSGPLTWGDEVGASRVMFALSGLLRMTGDPRYRASPWLARRAHLGISLLTPDPPRHG